MQTDRFCADCGLPLPAKEESAGCPHCLLRLAMGDEPGASKTVNPPAIPGGLRSRFFGDYELLSELARGGMGVIYRARQISLNRVVALKMLQQGHLPSPEAWLRFQTEIAASAKLNHPHIVALHESGTVDGAYFFTMRLLEGGNLSAQLATKRDAGERCVTRESQAAVVQMMLKVARAVHYAHQRGVLHRDLKPSNILLDEQGEPHVADFGLAKMLAQESAATLTDSILGSPNYMAPELANGRGKDVTIETDVYGLGVVLYESLTGVPPFQARTPVETIRKVLDEEPVAPRKLNSGLDADLETICLKCLQKNPAARYGSAERFATDLDRWSQRLPIVARPVGPFGSVARWSRRHPALATVSALLALTLLGAAVAASVGVVRIRQAEQAAVARLRESLLDQARVLRTTQAVGGNGEGRQLLSQAAALGGDAKFRERLRDEVLASLGQPQVEFAPLPDVKAEGPLRVLIDPAQNRLVRIADGTNLTIAPIKSSSKPRIFGKTGPGARLESFSPDGRFIAVHHARGFELHDIDAGRLVFSVAGRAQASCFATHAPLIAVEEDNCEVSFRELSNGKETHRLTLPPDPSGNRRGLATISISPDGSMLACSRVADNAIELIETESSRVRWRILQEAPALSLAWQPSRGRMAAATGDGRLLLLRLTDGAIMAGLSSPSYAHSLALDDATGLLVGACQDRRIRIWDLSSLRLVFEIECEARNLAFDENGLRLATVLRGDRVGWLTFERATGFTETVAAPTTRNLLECAYTGTGEMVMIGYPGRISLINASGRGARGGVTVGDIPVFATDSRGEFVLTSDGNGVTLRPLPGNAAAAQPDQGARLVIPGPRWRALAVSTDGSRIWAANAASNAIYGFARDFDSESTTLGPHEFADAVAASSDGRWIASGSSLELNVKIWDLKSRTPVVTMHAGRKHRISFSGDNRWVAVHGDVFDMRRVGTWEAAPSLPYPGARPTLGAAAFSPDGRILAVVENHDCVRLIELTAWKSLGLLRPPVSGSINALAFSPDGTQLAAACARGRLRLWDLRAIRTELRALNLDWELPPTPL